jgi:hypothetical protein
MSERQVRDWVVECLRRHLSPDALKVERIEGGDDNELVLYTRRAGTKDEVGGVFIIAVRKAG